MALYSIGASWNPKMSQYNRGFKRNLADVSGLSFAYRLNQWGPKVGPPMIPGNLASPITWIEGVFGLLSPSDQIQAARDKLNDALNTLPGLLTQVQSYLTQVQAYDSSSKVDIRSRSQALQAQCSGMAGTVLNWQTAGTVLMGSLISNQNDATKDQADALTSQVNSAVEQISSTADDVKKLGKDVASLLKDAGASPSAVQAIENTLLGSVSTLTWIAGGSLAIYLLLPTFLPRLASGLRKTVHGT